MAGMGPKERRGPETREGALPGDDQTPEHSHGVPIDQAQPSAPRKPELDTEDSTTDDADVQSSQRDI